MQGSPSAASLYKAWRWRDRRGQAASLKVDRPAPTSPAAQPRALLLIVPLGHGLLFWAPGGEGELVAAAGSPHGGQAGVRAAPPAMAHLLPSVQPLPSPGNQQINTPDSQHTCARSTHPARQLQTTEGRVHGKMCATCLSPLMSYSWKPTQNQY